MKSIFWSVLLIPLFSCTDQSLNTSSPSKWYDVEVITNEMDMKQKKDRFSEFGFVLFETGFNDIPVEVYRNGHLFEVDTITTDKSVDLAKESDLGAVKSLRNATIRINGGNLIHLDIDRDHRVVVVNYFPDLKKVTCEYKWRYPRYE